MAGTGVREAGEGVAGPWPSANSRRYMRLAVLRGMPFTVDERMIPKPVRLAYRLVQAIPRPAILREIMPTVSIVSRGQFSTRMHCRRALLVFLLAAPILAGCAEREFEPADVRGRVIDQDTQQGIPGAVVIATYEGSFGAHGASACNRIESAIADDQGWFELPVDHRAGARVLHAYHRDYVRGRPLRLAMQVAEHPGKWSVVVVQPSADNKSSSPVRVEPQVYKTRMAAKAASRENSDAYMKRVAMTDSDRQYVLQGLAVDSLCAGGPQSTAGGVTLVDALLDEATSRSWPSDYILDLQKTRDMVSNQNGRARTRAKQ